jgi:hypothetical protein
MQLTIYYTKEDQYLLDQIDEKADAERRSKSAVILAIIEEYFEADKKVGEILCDLGKLTPDKLRQATEIQKREAGKRKLGQILLAEKMVNEKDLRRALAIQSNSMSKKAEKTPTP